MPSYEDLFELIPEVRSRVLDRYDADPKEFVEAGAIFPLGSDTSGHSIIYMRCKVHKKVPQLMEFFRQFVIGVIDKVDREAAEKGSALVFDLTGVGFSNADMDFLQFLINVIKNYYPYGFRYCIVYNMPFILRPLWAIAVDQLPKYLGGEADMDFTIAPEECKTVKELAPKYGFTDEDVDKYMKMFEPHMKEAQKLVHS